VWEAMKKRKMKAYRQRCNVKTDDDSEELKELRELEIIKLESKERMRGERESRSRRGSVHL
jgi:hypothetical protein